MTNKIIKITEDMENFIAYCKVQLLQDGKTGRKNSILGITNRNFDDLLLTFNKIKNEYP
jgi:hypothetical protein